MTLLCLYCGKRFSQRKHLYAHMRNIHNKEPTFSTNKSRNSIICVSCSNIFRSYADLRNHMVTEHDIEIFKEEMQFENRTGIYLIMFLLSRSVYSTE